MAPSCPCVASLPKQHLRFSSLLLLALRLPVLISKRAFESPFLRQLAIINQIGRPLRSSAIVGNFLQPATAQRRKRHALHLVPPPPLQVHCVNYLVIMPCSTRSLYSMKKQDIVVRESCVPGAVVVGQQQRQQRHNKGTHQRPLFQITLLLPSEAQVHSAP